MKVKDLRIILSKCEGEAEVVFSVNDDEELEFYELIYDDQSETVDIFLRKEDA